MNYKIYNKGRLIAEFLYESDRDACLSTFIDLFPGESFSKTKK